MKVVEINTYRCEATLESCISFTTVIASNIADACDIYFEIHAKYPARVAFCGKSYIKTRTNVDASIHK